MPIAESNTSFVVVSFKLTEDYILVFISIWNYQKLKFLVYINYEKGVTLNFFPNWQDITNMSDYHYY